MEVETIAQEVSVIAPIKKVWKALTDPNEMRQWYFDAPEFRAVVGTEFHFYGEKKTRRFRTTCKVVQANPYSRLAHTWTYDGFPGETLVTFDLYEKDNYTRVKLVHEGLDKIAGGHEDLSIEKHLEGWHHILKSLKEYVENKRG